MQKVLRMRDLATTKRASGLLPVSPATVWRWVAEGKFPAPYKLGANVTVWDAAKVEGYMARMAGAV